MNDSFPVMEKHMENEKDLNVLEISGKLFPLPASFWIVSEEKPVVVFNEHYWSFQPVQRTVWHHKPIKTIIEIIWENVGNATEEKNLTTHYYMMQ